MGKKLKKVYMYVSDVNSVKNKEIYSFGIIAMQLQN